MVEVREHPDHAEIWASAFAGSHPDWDHLFDGYQACLDWPAVAFWQQLAAAYPDALILLTVRDPDAWWHSASRTIFPTMAATYFAPDAPDDGWTRMAIGMMAAFSPQWQDQDGAKEAFVAHNDRVRRTAPAHRLLEWQPGDGWGPLCERLGVAEPDEPFPHVNTEAEFRARVELPDES
jgi:hypothetical protein